MGKGKESTNPLSSIIKKYPWPTNGKRQHHVVTETDVDKAKILEEITRVKQSEEATSIVQCPYCGKVFASLDENGCLLGVFGLCQHVIGEESDGDFCFNNTFQILYDIQELYYSIKEYGTTSCSFSSYLTDTAMSEDDDFAYFLGELGISVGSYESFGDGPCSSGYFAFLTVDFELQDGLLEKLKVVRDRLSALLEVIDDILDESDSIAGMIVKLGTDIPAQTLLSFIESAPPEIGNLTTLLLINWFKNKNKLSEPYRNYAPSKSSFFLNWLTKGRQKEIMKSLEELTREDNVIMNIYSYLRTLSDHYVNGEKPSFGGPYNGVARNIYNYDKELFSGFYIEPTLGEN